MFLNPLMLAGIGGAAIPLVLHLLNRSRYRTVDWGAMMFLAGEDPRQQRRSRARQLILLGVRMAIVAILAVALARPIVQGRWAFAGDARTTAVLIVDRSASMGFDENGRTRMQLAREAAMQVLSSLRSGDQVSLLLVGDQGGTFDPQPTADLQHVAQTLASIQPSFGEARLAPALMAAQRTFARHRADNHELFIITDRQALNWEGIDDGFAAAWAGDPDVAANRRAVVIPIGTDASDNVSIESVSPAITPAVAGHPTEIEIRVRNHGFTARAAVPLTLMHGGRTLLETAINLPPRAAETVKFTAQFEDPGVQVLIAAVKTGGLEDDNVRHAAVAVVPSLRVLLVSGDEREGAFRSEGDFLRLALAPFKAVGRQGVDPAELRTIAPSELMQAPLATFDVVVLANVPQLAPPEVTAIERYVYDGGGLLIAPGNLCRVDAYNQLLHRDGAGVMPALLSPATAIDGAQATGLLGLDLDHPVLRFGRGSGDPIPTATIARYFPAEVGSSRARVLGSYVSGDPFLVESQTGRGRVLLVTTPLDADWSTLPLTGFYLPFAQSMIRYLGGGGVPDYNISLGQPIVLTIEQAIDPRRVTIVRPDGSRVSPQVSRLGARTEIRYDRPDRPGIHRLRIRDGDRTIVHEFVVAGPPRESDLQPLDELRWASLTGDLGFDAIDPLDRSVPAALADARRNRELWPMLLAVVLGLGLAEVALTWWIGGGSPATDEAGAPGMDEQGEQ